MRLIAFFPLAYFAGVQGFDLFAPYAAFFLTLGYCLNRMQRAKRQQIVPAPAAVAVS